MRFTRPGARPCHVASLDSTQLRGGILGARVDDERAGPKLRAGQVFELVAAAVRWIELDVKMMARAAPARWFLVHRHDVGERNVEEAIVLLQNAFKDARERCSILFVKVEKPRPVPPGGDVHLVRPPRKGRHEGDPSVVAEHCALASALPLQHVAIKAAPCLYFVPGECAKLLLYHGRDEWVRVNLAVGVAERDADLLAAILEDVDVTHFGEAAKLLGAVLAPWRDGDPLLEERMPAELAQICSK